MSLYKYIHMHLPSVSSGSYHVLTHARLMLETFRDYIPTVAPNSCWYPSEHIWVVIQVIHSTSCYIYNCLSTVCFISSPSLKAESAQVSPMTPIPIRTGDIFGSPTSGGIPELQLEVSHGAAHTTSWLIPMVVPQVGIAFSWFMLILFHVWVDEWGLYRTS